MSMSMSTKKINNSIDQKFPNSADREDNFGRDIMSSSVQVGSYKDQQKLSSFQKDNNLKDLQKSLRGSLYSGEIPTNLMLPQVTFLTEDKFKKNNECQVCRVPFGSLKDRQHHCRLCGNSICSLCSSRTINQQRVCDVCFLRATQLSYEKKRRKYLKAMKDHIDKMSAHVKAGKQKITQLDIELKDQKTKLEDETATLNVQYMQLSEKSRQQEAEKNNLMVYLKDLNDMLEPKIKLKDKLMVQEAEIDQKLRQVDTDLFLKQQNLDEKKSQYEKLKIHLAGLEDSDSFLNLSHYKDAFCQDPKNVAQQILAISSSNQLLNEPKKQGQQRNNSSQSAGSQLQNNNNKQSIVSQVSQQNGSKFYDAKYIDQSEIEQMMNNKQTQKQINKSHSTKNQIKNKNKNDVDGQGCAQQCRIF